MIRTRFCDLLGIEHPVIQASIGPWSSAELVAGAEEALRRAITSIRA